VSSNKPDSNSAWFAIVVMLAGFSAAISPTLAADQPKREIKVTWDFGPGSGGASDRDAGEKTIPVTYENAECLSRFSLEFVRYELARNAGKSGPAPGGLPFVMLIFRKHFAGDFKALPKVTFTQDKAAKKRKMTGKKMTVAFPFREKQMAWPAADWAASDIDVFIGAPGQMAGLYSPSYWFEISVACD
jgi:hypothetical protein